MSRPPGLAAFWIATLLAAPVARAEPASPAAPLQIQQLPEPAPDRARQPRSQPQTDGGAPVDLPPPIPPPPQMAQANLWVALGFALIVLAGMPLALFWPDRLPPWRPRR